LSHVTGTDPMVLRFFLLLLAGHLISDFLVQTSSIARNKGSRAGTLSLHGLWTYVVHALVLFPFWSCAVLGGLAALALLHMAIDWLKPRVYPEKGGTLRSFFLDQGLHLLTLLGFAWIMGARGLPEASSAGQTSLDPYVRAALVAAGFAFNGKGGATVVRLVLDRFPELGDSLREGRGPYATGATIGFLERFILYLLVLLGQWGALGFVIAAKSIARFKELDEKGFADYYLIGTLASVLTAIASGVVTMQLLGLL